MLTSIRDKHQKEVLDEMAESPQVGALINDVPKAAISIKCTEDIVNALSNVEKQLQNNSRSSEHVATKIFWLNIVLATATLVGTAATV